MKMKNMTVMMLAGLVSTAAMADPVATGSMACRIGNDSQLLLTSNATKITIKSGNGKVENFTVTGSKKVRKETVYYGVDDSGENSIVVRKGLLGGEVSWDGKHFTFSITDCKSPGLKTSIRR